MVLTPMSHILQFLNKSKIGCTAGNADLLRSSEKERSKLCFGRNVFTKTLMAAISIDTVLVKLTIVCYT